MRFQNPFQKATNCPLFAGIYLFIQGIFPAFVRGLYHTTANTALIPNSWLLLGTVGFWFLVVLTLNVVHQILLLLACQMSIPSAFVQVPFVVFYFVIGLFEIVSLQQDIEIHQPMNASFLQIYLAPVADIYEKVFNETGAYFAHGNDKANTAMLNATLGRTPDYFACLIIWCVVVGSTAIVHICFNYKEVLKSFSIVKSKQHLDIEKLEFVNIMNPKTPLIHRILLSAQTVISIVIIVVFFTYVFYPLHVRTNFEAVRPYTWFFLRTGIKHNLSETKQLKLINETRNQFQLPENHVWLEDMNVSSIPTYPLAYGPVERVCKYHNNCTEKSGQNKSLETPPPNIIMIVIESLSLLPRFVTKEVMITNESILNNSMVEQRYLPHLYQLSLDGISLPLLKANGIPTINGWFSLISGDLPQQERSIISEQVYNHNDDFASLLKQVGYQTQIVWPSSFSFDGKQQYVFRGRETKNKRVESFPVWFDEIYNYFPTGAQQKELGFDEMTKTKYWTPDRISSRQLVQHFNNSKVLNHSKPIFTFYGTVDTHQPFHGIDDKKYFDQFQIGVGMNARYSNQSEKNDMYTTGLRYTDAQIGYIIEQVKKIDSNTIIVVTGDHGAREVSLFDDGQAIQPNISNIVAGLNSGKTIYPGDSLFSVGGIISYLGDEPNVLEDFEKVKGKTFMQLSSHDDLSVTMHHLAAKYTGQTPMISSILGRNLVAEANKLVNGEIPQFSKIMQVHSTMLAIEASIVDQNQQLVRTHGFSNAGITTSSSFVHGIAQVSYNYSRVSKQQFEKIYNYLNLRTYLAQNNRIFNYNLRNPENVAIPEPHATYYNWLVGQIILILIVVCYLIGGVGVLTMKYCVKKTEALINEEKPLNTFAKLTDSSVHVEMA